MQWLKHDLIIAAFMSDAQVALSLANLAALRRVRGQVGAAEALLRRALGIREDALGPDHPLVPAAAWALQLGNHCSSVVPLVPCVSS